MEILHLNFNSGSKPVDNINIMEYMQELFQIALRMLSLQAIMRPSCDEILTNSMNWSIEKQILLDYLKEGLNKIIENNCFFSIYFRNKIEVGIILHLEFHYICCISKLTKSIENLETQNKKSNLAKIKSPLSSMEFNLNEIVEHYSRNMDILLNDKIYLTNEEFKESELRIRGETKTKFTSQYDYGSDSVNELLVLKIDSKLRQKKILFKQKYFEKYDNGLLSTKEILIKSIDE